MPLRTAFSKARLLTAAFGTRISIAMVKDSK